MDAIPFANGTNEPDPNIATDGQSDGASPGATVIQAAAADSGMQSSVGTPALSANAGTDGSADVAERSAAMRTHPVSDSVASTDAAATGSGPDAAVYSGGLADTITGGAGPGQNDAASTLSGGITYAVAAGTALGALVQNRGMGESAANASSAAATVSAGATPQAATVVSYQSANAGLVIDVTYDSSVLNLGSGSSTTPSTAQFEAAFATAVGYFTSTFTNPITIDINAGWGEVGGRRISSGAIGESSTNGQIFSYGQVRQALQNGAQSANQKQADSTLPGFDPTNGASFFVAAAEATALGLTSASSATDGFVGFDSSSAFFFNQSAPASGEYDFIGVAEHEISEVLGRGSYVGSGQYSPMDLFRFAAAKTRQTTTGSPSYFSIDNGTTDLQDWNNFTTGSSQGDLGDWATFGEPAGSRNTSTDAFNQAGSPGVVNPVTAVDTEVMNVLGYNTACYCRFTLILTERGEVAVEQLAIGDRVVTLSGEARPIKWIGRRSYDGLFALGQKHILPVCIKAGALADGVPRRDLWLSPNHALYLEGVLIETRDLVNGASIVQAERVAAIEYFHIELDSHDVIIAEGAYAESFLDDDNRGLFHNAHEYRALYPAAATGPARYCAPRRDQGSEVERARAALAGRAGLPASVEAAALGPLRGQIDEVGQRRICGWAQDAAHPDAPVCLDILAGGELIGRVVANRYRADLAPAGPGGLRHGFEFAPPPGLAVAPRSIRVRRSLDGAHLGRRAARRAGI